MQQNSLMETGVLTCENRNQRLIYRIYDDEDSAIPLNSTLRNAKILGVHRFVNKKHLTISLNIVLEGGECWARTVRAFRKQ